MSDQLEDLKRQRALVAEHLAWLDRLITAAEKAKGGLSETRSEPVGRSPDTAGEPVAPGAGADQDRAESVPESGPPADSSETDALFERFAADERPALNPPSKFGCWLGFTLLLLAGVGGAIAIIYGTYR